MNHCLDGKATIKKPSGWKEEYNFRLKDKIINFGISGGKQKKNGGFATEFENICNIVTRMGKPLSTKKIIDPSGSEVNTGANSAFKIPIIHDPYLLSLNEYGDHLLEVHDL